MDLTNINTFSDETCLWKLFWEESDVLSLMKFWNKCGKGFLPTVTQVTLLIPAATAARVEKVHITPIC